MRILSWIILSAALISCEKDPGIGGLNTITGKVEAIYIEEGSFDTLEVAPLADTRVYIVYGNATTQDDDVRTSADGSFKFEHLHPGDYRIYTYSDNLLEASGKEAIWQSVNLPKGRNTIGVPVFTVLNYVK